MEAEPHTAIVKMKTSPLSLVFNVLYVAAVGFSVLNKSKWKGGTLRIEIAKESFLQRCRHLYVLLRLCGKGVFLQYILTREYLFPYLSDWLRSDRLQQNWI